MDFTNLLGSSFFGGAIIHYFPHMLRGGLKEYMGKVKFHDLVDWVNADKNLWQELPDNFKNTLLDYGPRLGDLEWLTADWVIDASSESAPSIASLLTGWPEGHAWLERQVEDIKSHTKVGAK